MDNKVRLKLLDLFLAVPGINDFTTRTTLLDGIPNSPSWDRDEGNPHTDMVLIISQAIKTQLQAGDWALLIIIDNALARLEGTLTHTHLFNLQRRCRQNKPGTTEKKNAHFLAHHLLENYHFDLSRLVDKVSDKLEQSQGIIGFSIPCDYPNFLKIFCDRIECEFGREDIDIRPAFSLKKMSLDQAVNKITAHKKLLEKKRVLCPVRIGEEMDISPESFWQNSREAFREKLRYPLIVLMLGNTNCNFPQEYIIRLEAPQFTGEDVKEWALSVGNLYKWPLQRVRQEWTKHLVAACTHNNVLDMEDTYAYIEKTRNCLIAKERISFNDFLYAIGAKERVP